MELVNTDTLSQTVGILDRVIPLFVWVVSGMAVAIVAMAAYVVWQQKVIIKLQKDSNITINNNTSAINELKLLVISRKK